MRSGVKRLGGNTLSSRLLALSAVALMGVALAQKPSMLLLSVTPRGMAATLVRLLLGLPLAAGARVCVPGIIGGPCSSRRSGRRTLVAFALVLVVLITTHRVLGNRVFATVRLGDLIAHRAHLTQLVAFTLLWLTLLR